MTDTTSQRTGELNGYAKLNGDHSKPRPNSLHAGMFTRTSSSSSELLTPTVGAPLDTNTPPSADSSSSGTSQLMISSPLANTTTPTIATDQENTGAESSWKKATRKLSLTGTMLGFAKKEKYKDKLGGIS